MTDRIKFAEAAKQKVEPPKPTDSTEKSRLYWDIQSILKDYQLDDVYIPKDHEYWRMVEQYHAIR